MHTHDAAESFTRAAEPASPAALAMLSPRATVAPLYDLDSVDGDRDRALLRGSFLFEVGEAFDAELRVAGAVTARLEGRVVDHCRGARPGMQVAFENITPAARKALADLGAAGTR